MRTCGTAVAYFIMAIAFLHSVAVMAAPASGTATAGQLTHASHPAPVQLAGLWDAPNRACINKCETFVKQGCFKEQVKKDPTADAASLNDRCDAKYSLCLYDCMCENCKNATKDNTN